MFADPLLMPVACGCVAGEVVPLAMKTLGGIVTFGLPRLPSARHTPPDGGDVANATGNDADWPGATVRLAGRILPGCEAAVTVTLACAFPKFGVLAVIVAEPATIPVTGTLTVV